MLARSVWAVPRIFRSSHLQARQAALRFPQKLPLLLAMAPPFTPRTTAARCIQQRSMARPLPPAECRLVFRVSYSLLQALASRAIWLDIAQLVPGTDTQRECGATAAPASARWVRQTIPTLL